MEARGRAFQEETTSAPKWRGSWTQTVLRFSPEGAGGPQMGTHHPLGQRRWEGHQALAPSV